MITENELEDILFKISKMLLEYGEAMQTVAHSRLYDSREEHAKAILAVDEHQKEVLDEIGKLVTEVERLRAGLKKIEKYPKHLADGSPMPVWGACNIAHNLLNSKYA